MSINAPLADPHAANGRAGITPALLRERSGGGPPAPRAIPVGNWEQSLVTHPTVVAYPTTVAELVEIMRDRRAYPGPVRAIGSTHSTTGCIAADGGTLVDMTAMNRIVAMDGETVTAEAGALYIDVANALRARDLQFFVNVEIGNLTLGSAACCGTKEASFAPDEFGQVGSYVIGMRMVTPSGRLVEITRRHRRLLQLMRSSYGLLGLVYEVTLRVKALRPMAVKHTTVRLDRLQEKLPALMQAHQSVMFYVFPFTGRVGLELRDYHDGDRPEPHVLWRLRNWVWASAAPAFGYLVGRYVPGRAPRALVVGAAGHLLAAVLPLLRAKNTAAPDQIIRYPVRSDWRRYTFSLWAFPESTYPDVLRAYAEFCREHERTHGYRSYLLTVGYRISADRNALLSYSFHGPVITIDPVSNGGPGWPEFLDAFNRFALVFGGIPLLNQTDRLTPIQAREALRGRLRTFARLRRRFDPHDRLLSPYFRTLLEVPAMSLDEAEAPAVTAGEAEAPAGAWPARLPIEAVVARSVASGPDAPEEIANFGRTVRFAASRLTPRREDDVLDILRQHSGRKIRVLGSGHSWSDVGRSEDLVLDMREISRISVTDDGVAPSALVGAGCTLGVLLRMLGRQGLTLPTVGAITRQTVAGAVATATHGSGASSLSHYVREMRIATYRPGTGEPFILTLSADSSDPTEQAELRAARCSLGYLGVVLSVRFACVRRYAVEEELALAPTLDKALASAADYPLQQFVVIPWAWKFYVLRRRRIPHERAAGAREWVKRMAYRGYKLGGVDVGMHGAIKLFGARSWDKGSRVLMERVLPAVAWRGWGFTDDSQRILTLRHDLYRHVEMEVFVPARHLGEALDLVREITETFAAGGPRRRPLSPGMQALLERVPQAAAELSWSGRYLNHYLITCRRVCPDEALIAMSSGGEGDYWSISVITYRLGDPRFAQYCRILVLCLASLYGGRPHWGKHFPLTRSAVEPLYPGQLAEFRRICTRYDPAGVFRNAYAQRVLGFPAAQVNAEVTPERAERAPR